MIFIRILPKGKVDYLNRVTDHRVKGTKKVKQNSQYISREIIVDRKTVMQEPKKRIMVRRIIESTPYIMYRYAERILERSMISCLPLLASQI
jgi:hypothetical protein